MQELHERLSQYGGKTAFVINLGIEDSITEIKAALELGNEKGREFLAVQRSRSNKIQVA